MTGPVDGMSWHDADGPAAWLDMSEYPDRDPDGAVPAEALGALHGFLLSSDVTPLPGETWDTVLATVVAAVLGAGPGAGHGPDADSGADDAGLAALAGTDWHHQGSWQAGGYHDPLAGPHGSGSAQHDEGAHFEGGHW